MAFGFLCEINEAKNRLRVFDCKTRRLINWRNYENAELRLGKAYKLGHKKFEKCSSTIFGKNVQFFRLPYRRQFLVCAITWATSPNVDDMPEELRMKYQGTVWSPYFGFLADPDGLFLEKFKAGENGWICIEYALTDDFEFKIVETREVNHEAKFTEETPWERELAGELLTDDDDEAERELQKVKPTRRVRQGSVADYALCIRTNTRNHNYNPKNKGSFKRCDKFFHPAVGVYRSLGNVAKLGVWYRHAWRDERKKNKDLVNGKPRTSYHSVYAIDTDSIRDPIPTSVNEDGEIEITVDFVFNPDKFETAENREITDWRVRRQGFNIDATIWDKFLGVVEFEYDVKEFILKTIEDYKLAHPRRSEVVNSDPIGITVIAVPQKGYHQFALQYPKRGLFIAKSTDYIRYKGGGPVLFDSLN